jgi:hypothetical protein
MIFNLNFANFEIVSCIQIQIKWILHFKIFYNTNKQKKYFMSSKLFNGDWLYWYLMNCKTHLITHILLINERNILWVLNFILCPNYNRLTKKSKATKFNHCTRSVFDNHYYIIESSGNGNFRDYFRGNLVSLTCKNYYHLPGTIRHRFFDGDSQDKRLWAFEFALQKNYVE